MDGCVLKKQIRTAKNLSSYSNDICPKFMNHSGNWFKIFIMRLERKQKLI